MGIRSWFKGRDGPTMFRLRLISQHSDYVASTSALIEISDGASIFGFTSMLEVFNQSLLQGLSCHTGLLPAWRV